jgi:acetylornithine/succinyldiaminopimelate/putrescine aminotransferase
VGGHPTRAVIEWAEGCYLDFTSGIGVINTGHCLPGEVWAPESGAEQLVVYRTK